MQEGEELLFSPRLHWLFVLRHFIKILLVFGVLLLVWYNLDPELTFPIDNYLEEINNTGLIILSAIGILLLILVCGIFQFICIEYGITNKRLLLKRGVFSINTAEIPSDKIESIFVKQSFWGRVFNYGNVIISGTGGRTAVFYMVANPFSLRRRAAEIMEKNKRITVLHGDVPVIPKKEATEPVWLYGTFVRILQND